MSKKLIKVMDTSFRDGFQSIYGAKVLVDDFIPALQAAVNAGVDMLDTAISPFSGGTSQPPTESVVAALESTPYATGIDLKVLSKIKEYFAELNEKCNARIL